MKDTIKNISISNIVLYIEYLNILGRFTLLKIHNKQQSSCSIIINIPKYIKYVINVNAISLYIEEKIILFSIIC